MAAADPPVKNSAPATGTATSKPGDPVTKIATAKPASPANPSVPMRQPAPAAGTIVPKPAAPAATANSSAPANPSAPAIASAKPAASARPSAPATAAAKPAAPAYPSTPVRSSAPANPNSTATANDLMWGPPDAAGGAKPAKPAAPASSTGAARSSAAATEKIPVRPSGRATEVDPTAASPVFASASTQQQFVRTRNSFGQSADIETESLVRPSSSVSFDIPFLTEYTFAVAHSTLTHNVRLLPHKDHLGNDLPPSAAPQSHLFPVLPNLKSEVPIGTPIRFPTWSPLTKRPEKVLKMHGIQPPNLSLRSMIPPPEGLGRPSLPQSKEEFRSKGAVEFAVVKGGNFVTQVNYNRGFPSLIFGEHKTIVVDKDEILETTKNAFIAQSSPTTSQNKSRETQNVLQTRSSGRETSLQIRSSGRETRYSQSEKPEKPTSCMAGPKKTLNDNIKNIISCMSTNS